MSARPVEVILCCPGGCEYENDCAAHNKAWREGDGSAMLYRYNAMSDADRIALARSLVPDGWVVAMVPDRTTPETVPWRYGDVWNGIQDGASEESLNLICNGYADGFNAYRAAMLASGEETP